MSNEKKKIEDLNLLDVSVREVAITEEAKNTIQLFDIEPNNVKKCICQNVVGIIRH